MCHFDGHVKTLGEIPEALLLDLQRKLAENDRLWRQDQLEKPNNFKVFLGNTDHIVFQFPIDRRWHWPSRYYPVWTGWQDVLEPVIRHATAGYGYRNGHTSRIMLASLRPGCASRMHVDHTPSANVPHKIHVPLQTHPSVEFLIQDSRYQLACGYAYEVNNKLLHGTHNPSTVARVHLIFDYYDADAMNVQEGRRA